LDPKIGGAPTVKSFDEMPTISVPEDDRIEMPAFLAQMAIEHGPVFRRPTPPRQQQRFGSWLVHMVGPEANRFVLQSHRDAFSHERGWTPSLGGRVEQGLLNTDGPLHDQARKMMNPAFAVAYMQAYLPIMNRIVEECTRDWVERGAVDLWVETRRITFDVAAEALVGMQAGAEADRLRGLFFAIMHGQSPAALSREAHVAHITRLRGELDNLLLRAIAQRRAAPTDYILGMLTQARDEQGQPFSDKQLLGHVHILQLAGHETTTTLSAWLLYLLATHPDYLARVHTDMDEALTDTDGAVTLPAIRAARVLSRAIDEAGRLRPPVCNAPRATVRTIEFGGYAIPENTRVLLGLAACHMLPHVFANPEYFDPDRFAPPREEDKLAPYSLVSFGGGPRVCIGMSFAQVEIKAIAMHVLRAYTLTPIDDREVVFKCGGIIATMPNGMPVRVTARTDLRKQSP
jgi:cytochrome P450